MRAEALYTVPEHKEMTTSPLHTLASVPFQWEEKPGKPRHSTDLIPCPKPSVVDPTKSLEPPPRLYYLESPTTVLDGPYKLRFSSPSFRFLKNSNQESKSPGKLQLSSFVLGKEKMEKGNWWQWKGKSKSKSSDFLSSTDSIDSDDGRSCSARMASFRSSNGSLSTASTKSRTWASIYEGFKQAIPWKGSKSKKDALLE